MKDLIEQITPLPRQVQRDIKELSGGCNDSIEPNKSTGFAQRPEGGDRKL